MKRFIAAFLLSYLMVPAIASAEISIQQLVPVVQGKVPGVEWKHDKLLVGDINCDGQDDYVIQALTSQRVYIAVILGPLSTSSSVIVLNFGVGSDRYQDSLTE
ncbi:MAG TPA: hypothetical protein VI078_11510, partial [bacterium]